MNNKITLCSILVALVFCVEGKAANEPSAENHERVVPSSITGAKTEEDEVLTLNRLRDSGLSLQQIKQQAINIYLEVTRRDFQPTDKVVLNYPRAISDKGLLRKGRYLPPRAEWLCYYVGTLEPIIHLYANDVTDAKAGVTKVFVPSSARESLAPLWQKWAAGIQNLNEHLSTIYKLTNEEKPDNFAIGKQAVAMYNIGEELERTREKGVAIIRKAQQRNGPDSAPLHVR